MTRTELDRVRSLKNDARRALASIDDVRQADPADRDGCLTEVIDHAQSIIKRAEAFQRYLEAVADDASR